MKCTYINLAKATGRKEAIEKNFEQYKTKGWSLERFEAVDVDYVQKAKIPGSALNTQKANYLSHRNALKSRLLEKQHYMVFEDDIVIGKSTCDKVEKVINGIEAPWDLLYTEVCATNPVDMINMVTLKNKLKEGKGTLINLATLGYAGATSFIVNRDSKYKVYNLLEKNSNINYAMDIYIRDWVKQGKLNAFCIFPFVSSFSKEASISDNVLDFEKNTEHIWLTFRKLMWMDGNPTDFKEELDLITNKMSDEESRALGTVFSGMLYRNYIDK